MYFCPISVVRNEIHNYKVYFFFGFRWIPGANNCLVDVSRGLLTSRQVLIKIHIRDMGVV